MTPRMVTANRLGDGLVVYLDRDGGWSERIADGRVASDDAEAATLMTVAEGAAAGCQVVEPYLIDVVDGDGSVRPLRHRERIRAQGPTVPSDFLDHDRPGRG